MQSYEQALRLFATWVEEKHEITQVEAVKDIHIRSYINDLQARGKYTFCADRESERFNHPRNRRDYQTKISNTTINNYLRNMRAFFWWLVEVEYIARSPMSKIKLLPDERQAREYLEDNEVVKLLKSLDKSFYPEYRDYVLIMLMLDSGTRVGETLSAENSQLDLYERSLHLPADKTKGRKARTVFFSSKTARELRYWLQYKDRYCDSDYLFPVKQSGFTLQVSDFEKNFSKYCRRAGIKKRVELMERPTERIRRAIGELAEGSVTVAEIVRTAKDNHQIRIGIHGLHTGWKIQIELGVERGLHLTGQTGAADAVAAGDSAVFLRKPGDEALLCGGGAVTVGDAVAQEVNFQTFQIHLVTSCLTSSGRITSEAQGIDFAAPCWPMAREEAVAARRSASAGDFPLRTEAKK